MLPQSLVKSFEKTVMLLIHTGRAFELINRYCKHLQPDVVSKKKDKNDHEHLVSALIDLEEVGSFATVYMDRAEQEIMLMAHTNIDTGIVSYDSVGPEYILATMFANMCKMPLHNGSTIEDVYSSFARKMVGLSCFVGCHKKMCIVLISGLASRCDQESTDQSAP